MSNYLDLEPIKTLYSRYYDFANTFYKKGLNTYEYNYLFNPYKYLYNFTMNERFYSFNTKVFKTLVRKIQSFNPSRIPYNNIISQEGFIIYELNKKYNILSNSSRKLNLLEISTNEVISDVIYYIKPSTKISLLMYDKDEFDKQVTQLNTLVYNLNFYSTASKLNKDTYNLIIINESIPSNYRQAGLMYEENNIRLLIYNLKIALSKLDKNGNLIINFYEMKTDFTLSVIYELSKLFKFCDVYNPKQMYVSVERTGMYYAIFKDYKGTSNTLVKSLIKHLDKLIKSYKIDEHSFEGYFDDIAKEYYKKLYSQCNDDAKCNMEQGYINVIKTNSGYIKNKKNYPDVIKAFPKSVSKDFANIVSLINKHNRIRSMAHIEYINFISDNYTKIQKDNKYKQMYDKVCKYISYKYCLKFGIYTREEEPIKPDLSIVKNITL